MIRLEMTPLRTVEDAWSMLQKAIGVEFGTLPPYLYAMFSIPPGENVPSASRIKSVLLQEMVHMCLACNILNAIGGNPVLTPPLYPGFLPGGIGPDGKPLKIRLLRFSKEAMKQAMDIEEPVDPLDFPVAALESLAAAPQAVTIGEFYAALDAFLATLPGQTWRSNRNQISDDQFFAGQLFAVNSYSDAHRAISIIVSEGEGARDTPLDFQDELAHFYRFGEVYRDKVLTKANNKMGYQWGPAKLGVDWTQVFPCIADPGAHDFSKEPAAAQAAQAACNRAYSGMVDALQKAVTGSAGQLGVAVRAMFDLRLAAQVALRTPLKDPKRVAGPAFVYTPNSGGASQ